VWHDTTLGDDDVTEELLQLLVVSDGQLQMTRDDTLLLIITSGVASKFENFSSKVLENGSKINRCTSPYTLSVVALLQETVDTTNRELEASLGRARLGFRG